MAQFQRWDLTESPTTYPRFLEFLNAAAVHVNVFSAGDEACCRNTEEEYNSPIRIAWRFEFLPPYHTSFAVSAPNAHRGGSQVMATKSIPLTGERTPATSSSYIAKAYAAQNVASPLAPYTIERRALLPQDVQIDILYCGVCHRSALGAQRVARRFPYHLSVRARPRDSRQGNKGGSLDYEVQRRRYRSRWVHG
jgi:hypothetical protein